MTSGLALALASISCGRLGFDPAEQSTDSGFVCAVPANHDEDTDGVDDACDNCPHVANDGQNSDNDGVGDACDPSPTTAEDIAYFDPFTAMRPEWSFVGSVSWDGERVVISSPTLSVLEMPWTHTREQYSVGGRVLTGQQHPRQITLAMDASQQGSYYCELYDTQTPMDAFQVAATATPDGVMYNVLDVETVIGTLDKHTFAIDLWRDEPSFACTIPWDGSHELRGAIPTEVAATQVEVVFQGVLAELDFLIIIRSR